MITPDRLTEIRNVSPTTGPLGQKAINELLAAVARVEALAERMAADARDLHRRGLRAEALCTLLDAEAIAAALADPEEATDAQE